MSQPFTPPKTLLDVAAMPSPCQVQRDEQGRLIAATFESAPTPSAQAGAERWLVAIDGSEHSLHALALAARLASESGARALDLVNVQPWLSQEAAEIELPRRGWAACADARALLDARSLAWRLQVRMGEPASCIVEQARALGGRGIVIGARGLTAGAALLLGSVAQQVIHSAHGAVLVVHLPAPPKEVQPC